MRWRTTVITSTSTAHNSDDDTAVTITVVMMTLLMMAVVMRTIMVMTVVVVGFLYFEFHIYDIHQNIHTVRVIQESSEIMPFNKPIQILIF